MIPSKSFILAFIILCSVLVATGYINARGVPVVVASNLENIPMIINGFQGRDDQFSQTVYQELNADEHLYRHYQSSDGKQVDLYIGYYGTAKGGRSSHNPYSCLPGGGWGIVDTKLITLSPNSYPRDVAVSYILALKGDTHIVLFHWYQSAGSTVLSTGLSQNFQRFLGRLIHNRNDGAYVQIMIRTDSKSISESVSLAESFSETILDLLPGYWPEEKSL